MLANFYWIRCDIDLSGRGHLKADNEKTGNSQATQDWLAETGVNKATRAAVAWPAVFHLRCTANVSQSTEHHVDVVLLRI